MIAGVLLDLIAIDLGHPRKGVHAGGGKPDEERLALRMCLVHELDTFINKVSIHGFHPLSRQRTGVDNPLLAYHSESGIDGLIHRIGGPGVQHTPGTMTFLELRVGRVVFVLRFLFGVQVVQIAVELIESVERWQMFVPVTQVVLAELAGGIALRLQHFGERGILGLHAHRPPDHAYRGQACPDGIHARHERRTTGGAGWMRVMIAEHSPFLGNAIDVGCAVAHDTTTVNAQVGEADIVTPDDDDIGLLLLSLRGWRNSSGGFRGNCRPGGQQADSQQDQSRTEPLHSKE